MISMFPNSACFFFDGSSIFYFLILLNVFLNLLKNHKILLFYFSHTFNHGIIFFFESKPLFLAIHRKKLLSQECSFFVESFIFLAECFKFFIDIEKSFLPQVGFSLKSLKIFRGVLSISLLIIFWGILIITFSRRIFILLSLVLLHIHLSLHLLLLLEPESMPLFRW